MASSGKKAQLMQASESTKSMLPLGVVPGLRSVASANGRPASSKRRAGPYGMRRKKEQEGSSVEWCPLPPAPGDVGVLHHLQVVHAEGAVLNGRQDARVDAGELVHVHLALQAVVGRLLRKMRSISATVK